MSARGVPRQTGWSSPDDPSEYERPFSWWGFGWTNPEPRSLPWLIHAGSITSREAALLSLAMEARRSIIIAAEPPQAGKTTLLTALIDFMNPEIEPVYLRGIYERFEFMQDADPEGVYVLCNEISAHLPTYLWGRGVRILFEALEQGYPMATTMHASSAKQVIDQLSAYPLDVPHEHATRLDLVVTLDMNYVDNILLRRVTGIDCIDQHGGELRIEQLSYRDRLRAGPAIELGRMIRTLAGWLSCDDERATLILSRRERFLEECVRTGVFDVEAVREALKRHRVDQD